MARHFVGRVKRELQNRPKRVHRKIPKDEQSAIIRKIKRSKFAPYVGGLIRGKSLPQLRDLLVFLGLPPE